MKKIITTILASLIVMSAMGATAYCDKEVAATVGYTGEIFYVTLNKNTGDAIGTHQLIVKANSGNITDTWNIDVPSNKNNHSLSDGVYKVDLDITSGTSPRIYLVFWRTANNGETNYTGFEIASGLMDVNQTECNGSVDPNPGPDPEPAGMLPVEQSKTKFSGTGLQITITGYGCAPTSTYGCNDAFTLVADANNTVTMKNERDKGNASYCYYTFDKVPAANAVNKFTLTHVPTGDCAVITMTGESCTAVEACGGATPDPDEPKPTPSTIQFTGIKIEGAGATISSSQFVGASTSDYTVVAYEGQEQKEINVTLQNASGDWILVNKTGSAYNNYPYTFIITNTVNGNCGKLVASSATQFTQSACDETPELTPSVSIVQTESGPDYIDAMWAISNYKANEAWIYYKKEADKQFSKTQVSPTRPKGSITGLASETTYDIKIRLELLNNESQVVDFIESEVVQATTTAATFSIYQKAAYTNYLTIGWDANFSAEVYTVMYKEKGSSLEYLKYELSGKATSATITGLNEHTSYDIQVVAQLTAAQGGSKTAKGIFTTLDRTSCNTVSTEDEESDGSFDQSVTCEFKKPYEVEIYTSNPETKEVTIRYHYTQPETIAADQVYLLKRVKNGNALSQQPIMKAEGSNWFKTTYQPSEDEIADEYVYFAIKVVTTTSCESTEAEKMYVTRKLNYKMGVGCNDATELEFTKGEGDKVFYLQTNATIARVEVYDPNGDLVATPEITKPGASYVLNIASNDTFPTGTYKFMLYDINGRLSDVKLIYAVY